MEVARDVEDARKGDLLLLFATATAAFCPPWLALFWYYSELAAFAVVAACFVTLLGVRRIARTHFKLGSHLLCGAICATLFFNSLFTGGGASPLKQWMSVVPFLSATLLGLRGSTFWTSFVLGLILLLGML